LTGGTIYAVEIEGDLRLLFYLDGETVVSLIIGTHDIYKGNVTDGAHDAWR